MSTTPSEPTPAKDMGPIVAGPGKGYRIKFGLFALAAIVMGGWFAYDGFIGWPKVNQQLRDLKKHHETAIVMGDSKSAAAINEQMSKLNSGQLHSDWDILFQKILCCAVPLAGILVFLRIMRNSRGEYRLEGNTLHVPGHPPVALENITEVDTRLWDRKGIVYIDYALNDGATGTIRLDDYYHDRVPTDEIFNRIKEFVLPASQQSNDAQEKARG